MALEIRKIGLLACGYRIRWLGSSIRWRSRIIDYVHRERFTEVQVIVPYHSWIHKHSLFAAAEGTIMEDELIYRLPFHATLLYPQLLNL